MTCDFKNCRLWGDGECTDEEEREKCPLMEARLDLRAADDAFGKPRRDLDNMYQINYMGKSIGMSEADNLWYKLCVYYQAKTELFDRTLTDLRSPYDSTEAYIQGRERSLSDENANRIRRFVDEVAIGIPAHIKSRGLNDGKYRYSAQDWIDEYNRLVDAGEMDFINEFER